MTLQLISPYGVKPAVFNVPMDSKIPDEQNEILQIITFFSEEDKDVKELIENVWYSRKQLSSEYENLKNLCREFNKWSSKKHASTSSEKTRCTKKQIKYLLSLIYNRAIQEPGKLNRYEAFSPAVYGETSFDIIDEMLNRVSLGVNDIFLDLGSGVGNVVLHVAAVNNCKICYGFEKAELPAEYAKLMENEFIFWMNFFGKAYSNFKIYKADFLSDDEPVTIDTVNPPRTSTMNQYVRDIINDAKLVFVNNYAFGAEVDHQLKLRFCNMTQGSFIISPKPFCPINFRMNSRNLNDIGAIIKLDIKPLNGEVSWTGNKIDYFIQNIDRTKLEKYFEEINERLSKLNSKTKSTSKLATKLSKINVSLLALSQSSPGGNSETFNFKRRLTTFGKDSNDLECGLKCQTLLSAGPDIRVSTDIEQNQGDDDDDDDVNENKESKNKSVASLNKEKTIKTTESSLSSSTIAPTILITDTVQIKAIDKKIIKRYTKEVEQVEQTINEDVPSGRDSEINDFEINENDEDEEDLAKLSTTGEIFKCKYCNFFALEQTRILEHQNSEHIEEYKEGKAAATVTESACLTKYVQQEEREKALHFCTKCPYKADKQLRLNEHMLNHIHKDGFQKCRYCDYYVLGNAQLPQHERLHKEFVTAKHKTFECSKCPFQAKTRKLLKNHAENHHFKQNLLKCHYCDFYLTNQPRMKRHEELHNDVYKTVSSGEKST